MIRQLPAGYALVIRGGCAPVITRLPRAWKNRAYKRARRAGRATATLTPALDLASVLPSGRIWPSDPQDPGGAEGGDGAWMPWD
jgi:hypothetical protein